MSVDKRSEIQERADFSKVRYANCWEDADLLVEALEPEGRRCLSIGSAGDNSFSLLAAGAEEVVISEMNPAQVACIRLRMAAYQTLEHREFLILLGERDGDRRGLYERCIPYLNSESKVYWEHFSEVIDVGFGRVGKFENYFGLFRDKLLPLVHGRRKIADLLENRDCIERDTFYEKKWNSFRWRLLFKFFFSRFVMGRLGRDPAFFKYVEGSVADRILMRARHALVELEPVKNPYLRWILNGQYGDVLPHALRKENFELIRDRLDRVVVDARPLEAVLEEGGGDFDAYNLSDIFEYMSLDNTEDLLRKICGCSSSGARLAYWNMLAPRSRPESMRNLLDPLVDLSERLFTEDKAFFYSAFLVEEVV